MLLCLVIGCWKLVYSTSLSQKLEIFKINFSHPWSNSLVRTKSCSVIFKIWIRREIDHTLAYIWFIFLLSWFFWSILILYCNLIFFISWLIINLIIFLTVRSCIYWFIFLILNLIILKFLHMWNFMNLWHIKWTVYVRSIINILSICLRSRGKLWGSSNW